MKKNIILIILCACVVISTFSCFYYHKKYSEYYYKYIHQKAVSDYPILYAKRVIERPRYNYLVESDINSKPVTMYSSSVKRKFTGGISRVMAGRIAEAVWYTRFGENIIACRPYSVVRFKDKWVVAANYAGAHVGSVYMEINVYDGRIVRYILGK